MPDSDTANGPFGGLSPQEAGKKSAAARQAKQAKAADEVEPSQVPSMGPQLKAELVNAALGRGDWTKLPLDKRLAALVKANEYVNGRPLPMKDDGRDDEGGGFMVGIAPEEAEDGADLPGLPSETT